VRGLLTLSDRLELLPGFKAGWLMRAIAATIEELVRPLPAAGMTLTVLPHQWSRPGRCDPCSPSG